MSGGHRLTAYVRHEGWAYPLCHWATLSRFAIGDERDPRGIFRLADDRWDAWRYAAGGRPANATRYKFRFGGMRSFLKPYVKWFCYERLLGVADEAWNNNFSPAYVLNPAERFIAERGFTSIDDIAPQVVFEELWAALITHSAVAGQTRWSGQAVYRQQQSRSFWLHLNTHFGVPFVVPPTAPHTKKLPTEYAADRSKVIPEHVIKRLVNRLALHREGLDSLNRHDHLRLCVLVLAICLGRRFSELLTSPRGGGPDGPLSREPARTGSEGGALWFQFHPNKGGPASQVYISPEWEAVATYCVRELAKYSDEVRGIAAPEEQDQLILVSAANLTWGPAATYVRVDVNATVSHAVPPKTKAAKAKAASARGINYMGFECWLNGTKGKSSYRGIFEAWGITVDGTPQGPVYKLKLSYFRHTRQSALALDPHIPLRARQQDLNHNDPAAQFAYQHRLDESHDALLQKIREGKLCGGGIKWLTELLGVNAAGFSAGSPSAMTPRLRILVQNNPLFFQLNRVPGGLCALPQGPGGCTEFLNCTGSAEGGCPCFVIDSSDANMLSELDTKARVERRLQSESATAGRLVQAEKRETQARRTEELRDEALRRASVEMVVELRRLQNEIDETCMWEDE